MKKNKNKVTGIITVILLIVCLATSSMVAFAGTDNKNMGNDGIFTSEEIPYSDWRYERESEDITLKGDRNVIALDDFWKNNEVQFKNKKIVSSGNALEIELNNADFANGGSLGVAFGNNTVGKADLDSEALSQKKAGKGDVYLFSIDYAAATEKFTLVKYKTNAKGTDYDGYEFKDMDFADYIKKGKADNIIIRLFWSTTGTFEVSVRYIGESVSNRLVLGESETYGVGLGGYLTTKFRGETANYEIADIRAFQLKNTDTVNSELSVEQKVCGLKTDANTSEELIADIQPINTSNSHKVFIGKRSVIHFNKTATNNATLVNRKIVETSDNVENSLFANFTIKINEIKGDKQAGYMLGLKKINDVIIEGGSYLYFFKEGVELKYGLKTFAEDGKFTQIIAPTTLSGNLVDVSIVAKTNNRIELMINGELKYSSVKDNEIITKGNFGFCVSGSETDANNYADFDIVTMNFMNYFYDKPENSNIITKFNNNEYNTNQWYMRTAPGIDGGDMYVKDESLIMNGEGDGGTFATRDVYSNFEMKFDVYDFKNTATKDSNGKIIAGASTGFTLGIGSNSKTPETGGNPDSSLRDGICLYFGAAIDQDVAATDKAPAHVGTYERSGKTHVSMAVKNGWEYPLTILDDKYAFGKVGYTGKVNFKITMEDATLTVKVKLPSESSYTSVFSYTFTDGSTPKGNIFIMSQGNNNIPTRRVPYATSATFDNIIVNNLDENGNIIKHDFESSIPEYRPDYNYTDNWQNDYLLNSTVTDATPFDVLKGLGASAIITLGVVAGFISIKKMLGRM